MIMLWHRLCSCPSASKPKYTFDFSEEEEEEDDADDGENGNNDGASSPIRLKDEFPSSDTKDHFNDHNDEEDIDDNEVSFSPLKQKPS